MTKTQQGRMIGSNKGSQHIDEPAPKEYTAMESDPMQKGIHLRKYISKYLLQ